MKFSANLGLLFREFDAPKAVAAAAKAGFSAIECHTPYDTPAEILKAACAEVALPLLAINTDRGHAKGDIGLAALAGREQEAQRDIDRAISYAVAAGAGAVHVLAGINGDATTFEANLRHATRAAAAVGVTILIEPRNCRDTPNYFLSTTAAAMAIQDRIGAANLRIMFDCYHVQVTEGDLFTRACSMLDRIGHIQFAAVPDRGEPDEGEVNFKWLLPALCDAGYEGYFGAEYQPRHGNTQSGLAWLAEFSAMDPVPAKP